MNTRRAYRAADDVFEVDTTPGNTTMLDLSGSATSMPSIIPSVSISHEMILYMTIYIYIYKTSNTVFIHIYESSLFICYTNMENVTFE